MPFWVLQSDVHPTSSSRVGKHSGPSAANPEGVRQCPHSSSCLSLLGFWLASRDSLKAVGGCADGRHAAAVAVAGSRRVVGSGRSVGYVVAIVVRACTGQSSLSAAPRISGVPHFLQNNVPMLMLHGRSGRHSLGQSREGCHV